MEDDGLGILYLPVAGAVAAAYGYSGVKGTMHVHRCRSLEGRR